MGSESTSHAIEEFFSEKTMIFGKNWERGDLFFSDDFAFIY